MPLWDGISQITLSVLRVLNFHACLGFFLLVLQSCRELSGDGNACSSYIHI